MGAETAAVLAAAAIGAGASAATANKQDKARKSIAAEQKKRADIARASEVRSSEQAEKAELTRRRLAQAEANKQVAGQLQQREIATPSVGRDISSAVLNESAVG